MFNFRFNKKSRPTLMALIVTALLVLVSGAGSLMGELSTLPPEENTPTNEGQTGSQAQIENAVPMWIFDHQIDPNVTPSVLDIAHNDDADDKGDDGYSYAPEVRTGYLIQSNGPVPKGFVALLESKGTIVHQYIAQRAYLVGATEQQAQELALMAEVGWVGAYLPEYKIAPGVAQMHGEASIILELFSWASIQSVQKVVVGMGGSHLKTEENGLMHLEMNIPAGELVSVSKLPEVLAIHPKGTNHALMDKITSNDYMGHDTPQQVGGYNGSSILGEVQDNGIDIAHVDLTNMVWTDGNVTVQAHGTSVSGIVFSTGANNTKAQGALYAGNGAFSSWGTGRTTATANLWDGDFNEGPAGMNGVFQTNSWFSWTGVALPGHYNTYSYQDDIGAINYPWQLQLWGAGNSNNEIGGLASPSLSHDAVAKNVLTVGAIFHKNTADMSDDEWIAYGAGSTPSQGPTADGRQKPDLAGPFDGIYTTDISGSGGYCGSNPGCENEEATNDYYPNFGGTSGATPVTAGVVGLAYEMYIDNHFGNNPTNATPLSSTIKALMIADASQYNLSDANRNQQGWGAPDAERIYTLGAGGHYIEDGMYSVDTDQTIRRQVYTDGTEPLKITLAWLDPVASSTSGTARTLINNLDLKVIAPDGSIYWGNNGLYNNLWSTSGTDQNHWTINTDHRDDLNNLENVFIQNPQVGLYTVETSGRMGDLPQGPQNFSLVTSGAVRMYSTGRVSFENGTYALSGNPSLEVTDSDLNLDTGSIDTATVLVNSTTDPEGITIVLNETEVDTGIFVGETFLSGSEEHGKVQVAHGELLYAWYDDEDWGLNSSQTVNATANIDGDFPTIFNVQATSTHESITVTWETDEHSRGLVRFNQTLPLIYSGIHDVLALTHIVTISALTPKTTYKFLVESTDIAGNTGIDDNSSNYYEATTLPQPPVLLVDDDLGADYQKYFTDALDNSTYTYSVWDHVDRGTPSASYLENFEIVIWTTASDSDETLMNEDEQELYQYLDNGGKFFLSSHEYLFNRGLNWFGSGYFHIGSYTNDILATSVNGVNGDPITDGLGNVSLDHPYSEWTDEVNPDAEADTIFTKGGSGESVALRHDSGAFKTVFFAFPFESIYNDDAATGNDVMQRVLDWLAPVVREVNVTDIDVGDTVNPGITIPVNGSILNQGWITEDSISVNLTQDGGIVDTLVFGPILRDDTGIAELFWDTPASGDYSMCVQATAVPGESDLTDNQICKAVHINEPPVITTGDVVVANEDTFYSVDYDSSDPELDAMSWTLTTNADFLGIEPATGVLSGTPDNSDVGGHWVNVSVVDEYDLNDWHNFTLHVSNVLPNITNSDMPDTLQDDPYWVDYNSTDDEQGSVTWDLLTDAGFLDIDPNTGVLSGTPGYGDVGQWSVNVSVDDGAPRFIVEPRISDITSVKFRATAVLNQAMACSLEYDTNLDFTPGTGNSSFDASPDLGSGACLIEVSGLALGETYHYRFYAINSTTLAKVWWPSDTTTASITLKTTSPGPSIGNTFFSLKMYEGPATSTTQGWGLGMLTMDGAEPLVARADALGNIQFDSNNLRTSTAAGGYYPVSVGEVYNFQFDLMHNSSLDPVYRPWLNDTYNFTHVDSIPVIVNIFTQKMYNEGTVWRNFTLTVNGRVELHKGWNLISSWMIPDDEDLGTFLSSISGQYDRVMWYDSSSGSWLVNDTNPPSSHNSLPEANHTMAIWINVTSANAVFIPTGTQPITPTDITLYPGWNMVSFPSITDMNVTNGLNNLNYGTADGEVSMVVEKSSLWSSTQLGPDDMIGRGKGYWMYLAGDVSVVWTVGQ